MDPILPVKYQPPQKRKWARVDELSSATPLDNQQMNSSPLLVEKTAIAAHTGGSLTDEMKRIMHQMPNIVPAAMDLLDLYFCLWDSYVINSARKIHLEDQHRLLCEANARLADQNRQLKQMCDSHELLLWDRQQAFLSMNQGILDALQSGQRPLSP